MPGASHGLCVYIEFQGVCVAQGERFCPIDVLQAQNLFVYSVGKVGGVKHVVDSESQSELIESGRIWGEDITKSNGILNCTAHHVILLNLVNREPAGVL